MSNNNINKHLITSKLIQNTKVLLPHKYENMDFPGMLPTLDASSLLLVF